MGKRGIISSLVLMLAGIATFVYTSPMPPPGSQLANATRAARAASTTASARAVTTGTLHTKEEAKKAAKNARRRAARDALDAAPTGDSGGANAPPRTVTKTRTVVRTAPAAQASAASLSPARCDDFQWQQDAQALYVWNLADPHGLDGPPGPADDDGIACSLLPKDPARPASTPAGAKPAPRPRPPQPDPLPTTPTMDELLSPQLNYFGASTPSAPSDWKEFEIFVSAAEKRPNLLEWFQGWDRDFPREHVISSWRRNALPLISWEPRPTVQPTGPDSDNTYEPGHSLASIINGEHDAYIDRYAAGVRDLGLPIAIRFAHEMNGNWFPWSEERNGNGRGEYVQAWRRVHDRFTMAGATNVIWVWSPNVITGRPSVRLAPLYPGDEYVDWMGLVGYYRRVTYEADGQAKPATFDNTYGSSLDELRAITAKPILLTEVGATEVGGNKVAWTTSLFDGMENNLDVVGFVWFDHSVNGNDWRIESSPSAARAFAAGVASDLFGAGRWVPR